MARAKGTDVYDTNHQRIGELDDITIRLSEPNKITKMVVTNPEENTEFMDLFVDNRLVIPMNFVKSAAPGTIIVEKSKELLSRLNEDMNQLMEGEYYLGSVKSNEVHDSNGENLGNIKTMSLGERPALVVGDGVFDELLEKIGLERQTDLLIDLDEIAMIDEAVTRLKQNKNEYKKMIKEYQESSTDNSHPTFNYPFRTHPPH